MPEVRTMTPPPGMVGVIAQDTARFSEFSISLTGLTVPPGTAITWRIGHDVAENTNALAEALLGQEDLEWLWILGDDHSFAPDLLTRLLSVEADIVVPLCLTRMPPYLPGIFIEFAEDGVLRRRADLASAPEGGIANIHSAGSAGMLIRRHVFEKIEAPWFKRGFVTDQQIGEDVAFCDLAREAGFSIRVDLDAQMGHLTTASVWPIRTEDGWTKVFSFAGGYQLAMPA